MGLQTRKRNQPSSADFAHNQLINDQKDGETGYITTFYCDQRAWVMRTIVVRNGIPMQGR
jgi:hypothetical protein